MAKYELPVDYTKLTPKQRKEVREQYLVEQNYECYYCKGNIYSEPPKHVTDKPIKRRLYPPGFFRYPIHLQHNHITGMTEGAVHNYCNAVLWEHEGR